MALTAFIQSQIDQLLAFFEFPGLTLRVLRREPDMEQIVKKVLARLDEQEGNPHIMVVVESPFNSAREFYETALAEISRANEAHRDALREAGLELPAVPKPSAATPGQRFASYVSEVANALPDEIGAYVVIINPRSINNGPGFEGAMAFLADHTDSEWAKYLVVDGFKSPTVPDIVVRSERGSEQDFHITPDQIEAGVGADLKRPGLPPHERVQLTALAAAFASSSGRLDEALKLNRDAAAAAEKTGQPAPHATALYNLGNVHLARQEFGAAQDQYSRAASLCLANGLNPLLPMVLTNLGVALHREGRLDESLGMFEAARKNFRAQNNRPGEAHALDCRAMALTMQRRNREAAETWKQALALYDGITAPHFQDVRVAGRDDILRKLEDLKRTTDGRDGPIPRPCAVHGGHN